MTTSNQLILAALAVNPMTIPQLAMHLQLRPESVTKTMDRLERKGLARRQGSIKPPRSGRPAYIWRLL